MGGDDDQKDEGNDEEDHQDQEKDDAGVLFVAASESDNPEQSCRPSGKRESVATDSSSTSSTIRNSRHIPWLDSLTVFRQISARALFKLEMQVCYFILLFCIYFL